MGVLKIGGLSERRRLISVPVERLRPNPNQPRKNFDREGLEELASSIRRHGVIQPLTVRKTPEGYELVTGERRLRASKMAGLKDVPCIVTDTDDTDSSVLALVENLHRRDLDFIEEAEAIYHLVNDHGLSQEECARRLGRSQPAVANKLRVLRLPGELLYIIREHGLTERHARALVRLEGENERIEALRRMIDEKMTVARAEEMVDEMLSPEGAPAPPESEKPARREKHWPVYVIKDVRLFLNTVSRGMTMMKQSGIDAEYGRSDTDTDIVLTIRIPKTSGSR